MANQLISKKLKIELEFTVEVDEVGEKHLSDSLPASVLPYLKQVQQAVTGDETALNRLLVMAILNRLQGYADYLAAQDSTAVFARIADGFPSNEADCLQETELDLQDLTRPIRTSSLTVRLDESRIQEQVNSPGGESGWQPVWQDLRPHTEFGKLLDCLGVPQTPFEWTPDLESSHYLAVRYLTRQKDGVHIEGRCSCDRVMEGVGNDECKAFDSMWAGYKRHLSDASLAKRIDQGSKLVFGDQ